MILEHAILNVRRGEEEAFEHALKEALPLIAASQGFIAIEVRPCLEQAGKYLLLVQWESLAAHTVGFRSSDRYAEWKRLLHGFYDPFPVVEHYGAPVAGKT